jgi:cytochrome c biogenesis factor
VPPEHRSNFERWGAPPWVRGLAIALLGAILVANLGVITHAWIHDSERRTALLVLWLASLVILLLLIRRWKAVVLGSSRSRGSNLDRSGGPSNNRWRGP